MKLQEIDYPTRESMQASLFPSISIIRKLGIELQTPRLGDAEYLQSALDSVEVSRDYRMHYLRNREPRGTDREDFNLVLSAGESNPAPATEVDKLLTITRFLSIYRSNIRMNPVYWPVSPENVHGEIGTDRRVPVWELESPEMGTLNGGVDRIGRFLVETNRRIPDLPGFVERLTPVSPLDEVPAEFATSRTEYERAYADGRIGLKAMEVDLISHQRVWKFLYEEEVDTLRSICGRWLIDFEHVGSTAIGDIDAKPVIDIVAIIEDFELIDGVTPILRALGYYHMTDDGVPEREFFIKGSPEKRTHHLSICEENSAFRSECLLFRDFLRANPDIAREYESIKHVLARKYPDKRTWYTSAKRAFIRGVLEKAKREGTVPTR